ncbi:MAG TPA: alpha/beta fold hydrolase [Candidatus Xenobia bacterium]
MRWTKLLAAGAYLLVLYLAVTGIVTFRLYQRAEPPMVEVSPSSTEAFRVTSLDGQDIGGWYSAGEAAKPVVLVLHGMGGNRSTETDVVRHLQARGLGVCAISFRAHGDSSGDRLDLPGTRLDTLAAMDWLQKRCPGRTVEVFGSSLGAGAALMAGGELGQRVHAYLLESPYHDLDTAVWNRVHHELPWGFDRLAYAGLRLWAPVWVPGGLAAVHPGVDATAIPSNIPIVLMAGSADTRATLAEIQAIYRSVASHARLVVFPGADHGGLGGTDPKLYWGTFDETL